MRIWRITTGSVGASSGPTSTTPILSTTSCPSVTLPSSGGIGNYGGGVARKRVLLELEGAL